MLLGALLRVLSWALAALPWSAVQRCGRGLGSLGWALSRRDRRRALEHLAIAFPAAGAEQRQALGRASFRHLGETLAESLYLMRHDCAEVGRRVRIEGWSEVERARASGRPLLVVTAHCGNWELIDAAISCRGLAMAVIARRLDEPEFDELLVGLRRRFGTTTIARGAPGAARELLRALRSGGCLGIVIDQDTKVDGVWVPFFGRPAYTPVAAADLVRRLGAIPLPTFAERLSDGSHVVRFAAPPELPDDPTAATAALTRPIEDQIRRRPEQWVWFHRRWRRQPPVVAALAAAALALTCGPRSGTGWERIDLTRQPPRVDRAPAQRAPAAAPETAFLGAAEVRDLRLVPGSQLGHFPQVSAGQVRALAQAVGSRLVWPIELGGEPSFGFTPLGSEWPSTYRVAARSPGGVERELYRQAADDPAALAPARVELDLAAFRGAAIELVLEVAGEPPRNPRKAYPTARWGSPEVWSRRVPPRRAARRPSVLLIGLDALRADHVGPRGERPSLTPALDRLAAESEVWTEAYTCFNSTNSSFASMMTGLYAKNHGVYDLQTPLPPEHLTLAERFQAAGYRTLAVIAARHLGDHNSGLGQGFDRVERAERHIAAELGAALVADWVAESDTPFFVWLHVYDPHTPHTPPAPFSLGYRPARPAGPGPVAEWLPFREIGARVFDEPVLAGHRDLYAGEVAYVDRQLERLLAFLDSRGRLADTWIAVVADHGDNLGEHGALYRHIGLHETVARVPLLIRRPGPEARGRPRAGLVQTLDLFPTLLAAAGLAAPESDGVDLLAAAGRGGRGAVFAEASHHQGAMVRRGSWKYIENRGEVRFPPAELYDLGRDPREERNLAGAGLPQERELAGLLAAWERERRPPRGTARALELTEEERARLRALGYLQ